MNGIKSDWTALRQVSVLGPMLYSLYMLQLTKKHNKIQVSYTLGSTVHEHVKASNIPV